MYLKKRATPLLWEIDLESNKRSYEAETSSRASQKLDKWYPNLISLFIFSLKSIFPCWETMEPDLMWILADAMKWGREKTSYKDRKYSQKIIKYFDRSQTVYFKQWMSFKVYWLESGWLYLLQRWIRRARRNDHFDEKWRAKSLKYWYLIDAL